MKTIAKLSEADSAGIPSSVIEKFLDFVSSYWSDFSAELSLIEQLGGTLNLCESFEDLSSITANGVPVLNLEHGVDVLCMLPDEEHYVLIFMSNNAGGNIYLIPRSIVQDSGEFRRLYDLSN
jgi:hypothetical protein